MSNKVRQVKKVADVIKVLHAGVEFYSDAIQEIKNRNVKLFFVKMIGEREVAIEELQAFAIAEQGEKEQGESVAVNVRNMYTKLVGIISFDKDHTYISQLEEVEDKTLEVIDEALKEEQPEVCAEKLRNIRAAMQTCHDEMKALQEATA
jgi:uncharacterized protein (TIGR02284 family)